MLGADEASVPGPPKPSTSKQARRDAHRPAAASLRDEWRRVLQLSDRELLELYRRLRDYLALGPGDRDAVDPEIEARAASLEAMQRAAEHERLPPGQAPTVQQYQAAHRALALPLSHQQVIRRWGYWRTAVMAFEGQRTVRTTEQRSLLRATAGRARRHEDYIAGVRRWLDSQPAVLTDGDYDGFVTTYNQRRPDGATPLVKAHTLRRTFAIGWNDILAVAHGQLDLADAREQARDRDTNGDLVSTIDIARILDVNASTMTARTEHPGSYKTASLARTPSATTSCLGRTASEPPSTASTGTACPSPRARSASRSTGTAKPSKPGWRNTVA